MTTSLCSLLTANDRQQAHPGLGLSNSLAVPDPVHIIGNDILCRLDVWSEEQWETLPDDRRIMAFVHAPGLGWVSALPVPLTPAPFA